MTNEPGSAKHKPVLMGERDIYIRSSCVLVSEYTNAEEEKQFLQSLVPQMAILDLIAPFELAQHVGVHVRMEGGVGLDEHAYERVDNWTENEHKMLQYWREKSNYKHFIKHLDSLIEREPETKIFLATDRKENYEFFKKYYGDRLIYLERNLFDRSKEQLIYAFADMLLLSKCNRLVGSNWSSFTELAIKFNRGYKSVEMSGRDF